MYKNGQGSFAHNEQNQKLTKISFNGKINTLHSVHVMGFHGSEKEGSTATYNGCDSLQYRAKKI